MHEAIEHYERALSVDPDLTDFYPALMFVLWMTGDRAGAREQIRAGLRHGWSPPDDLVRRLDPEKAR